MDSQNVDMSSDSLAVLRQRTVDNLTGNFRRQGPVGKYDPGERPPKTCFYVYLQATASAADPSNTR